MTLREKHRTNIAKSFHERLNDVKELIKYRVTTAELLKAITEKLKEVEKEY